jgi:hypothetical protein
VLNARIQKAQGMPEGGNHGSRWPPFPWLGLVLSQSMEIVKRVRGPCSVGIVSLTPGDFPIFLSCQAISWSNSMQFS